MKARVARLTWASMSVVLLFTFLVGGSAPSAYGSSATAVNPLVSNRSDSGSHADLKPVARAFVGQGADSSSLGSSPESVAIGAATPESSATLSQPVSLSAPVNNLAEYASRASRTRGQPALV